MTLGLAAVLLALVVAGVVLRRAQYRRLVWLAAFIEQGRVERVHHTHFRPEQRIHAIQQRLARKLGQRYAFSARTRKRIVAELAVRP